MKKVLSSYAEEVLRRLVACGGAPVDADGRVMLAGRAVPARVVAALTRADFLRLEGGRARPTAAGVFHLRRRAAAAFSRPDGRQPGAGEPLSPFRHQHLLPRRPSGSGARRRPVPLLSSAESPLQRLARLKDRRGRAWFPPELILAGERLRTDFELAGLRPRTTIRYEPVGPDRTRGRWRELTPGERMLDARQRFHAALDAVGPGLRDVLIAVCCHLEGLEEIERRLDWPQRAGKLVLRIALERLAAHYDRRTPSAPPASADAGPARLRE